jgi:TolA-binding protein
MSEKIQDYLSGTLTDIEHLEFEKELEINTALQKEYEMYKKLDSYLEKKAQLLRIQQAIEEVSELKVRKKKQQRKQINFIVGIAASLVLAIGLWSVITSSFASPKNLYAKQYSAFVLPTERGADSVNQVRKWKQAYKVGDYTQVVMNYNSLPEQAQTNAVNRLALANALMEKGDFIKASTQLKNQKNIPNKHLMADFNWYLGLCYLSMEKSKLAKSSFEKVLADSRYKKKAETIISKLQVDL